MAVHVNVPALRNVKPVRLPSAAPDAEPVPPGRMDSAPPPPPSVPPLQIKSGVSSVPAPLSVPPFNCRWPTWNVVAAGSWALPPEIGNTPAPVIDVFENAWVPPTTASVVPAGSGNVAG